MVSPPSAIRKRSLARPDAIPNAPRNAVEHRPQDPVQRGERELRLGLDPAAPEDAHIVGTPDRVLEERRLADPRLAADDEYSTPRLARLEEQALNSGALHAPSDEHGVIVGLRDRGN
jgi:hypothetical protein